jgi:hypothetical protein
MHRPAPRPSGRAAAAAHLAVGAALTGTLIVTGSPPAWASTAVALRWSHRPTGSAAGAGRPVVAPLIAVAGLAVASQ